MLFISYPQDFNVEKVTIISILFLKKLDMSSSHMAEAFVFVINQKHLILSCIGMKNLLSP